MAVVAYSAINLGDDVFTTLVLRRYPRTDFHFFAPNREALGLAAGESNAHIITDAEYAATARTFDALIVLGGSMFQQTAGWQRQWGRYAIRFLRSWRVGVPVGVIGASFGPVRTLVFRQAYRALFRTTSWLSVRDELSARRLKADHVFPDLAFADERLAIRTKTSGHVAVQIMDFGATGPKAAYISGCAALVEQLTRSSPVRIFSFQEAPSVSDGAVAESVLELLSKRARGNVELIRYKPTDVSGFLAAFAECHAVVATRFHSMVFAVALAQRLVVIDYHEKSAATLRSLGLVVPTVLPSEVESSVDSIVRAVTHYTASDLPCDGQDLARLREAASRHLLWLDNVLSEPEL